MRRACFAVLISICALTGRASAQTEPPSAHDDRWQPQLAVLGQIGVGTPVGLLGAVMEYAPLRYFVLELGAGVGGAGPQFEALARLRLPILSGVAIGIGAGVSNGDYAWREGPFIDNPAAKRADPAWFGNAALVIEHRYGTSERGFQMRELVGYGLILNRDDLRCTEEIEHCKAAHSNDGGRVPFFGMGFGYYF